MTGVQTPTLNSVRMRRPSPPGAPTPIPGRRGA
jgi:hypothetical protein